MFTSVHTLQSQKILIRRPQVDPSLNCFSETHTTGALPSSLKALGIYPKHFYLCGFFL